MKAPYFIILASALFFSGCIKTSSWFEPKDKSDEPPTELVAVDLGLPSGTQWASQNLLASNQWDLGGKFAWGETHIKDSNVYSFLVDNALTAYNSDERFGPVDNRFILEPEDDAATIILGDGWRMPTRWDFEELLENCTVNGTTVKGGPEGYMYVLTFTSNINSKSILLPCSTNHAWSIFGTFGAVPQDLKYWTNCVSSGRDAQAFYPDTQSLVDIGRSNGLFIRPVLAGRTPVESISTEQTSLSLPPGANNQIIVDFTPLGALDKRLVWQSSDETVAYIDNDLDKDKRGMITALYPGASHITAVSPSSGLRIEADVTVTDYVVPRLVDMGLPSGTLWSDRALGAVEVDDLGQPFAWGSTHPQLSFCNTRGGNVGWKSENDNLAPEEDAARVILGEGWRTPSMDDFTELVNNCRVKYDDINYKVLVLTSKINGNSLRFPCLYTVIFYWTSRHQGDDGKSVAARPPYPSEDDNATLKPSFKSFPREVGWAIRPVFSN